jgi:hypothetical protein
MAMVVTYNKSAEQCGGSERTTYGSLAWDSTYPTNGEPFTARPEHMRRSTQKSASFWPYQSVNKKIPHSTGFSGSGCYRSSEASGGEDLQIEAPVCGGDSSAFHFYATLPRMHGPTLIRDQVVQMCQPREERLLAPAGMMEAFHRE